MNGPQFIGKSLLPVNLTGKLFPFNDNRPVLLSIPGSDFSYLPCFSNAENLRVIMVHINRISFSIKQIIDGIEFFQGISLNPIIKVMVDPYFTEEGTIRFFQIEILSDFDKTRVLH
jgi:hypothetical protein